MPHYIHNSIGCQSPHFFWGALAVSPAASYTFGMTLSPHDQLLPRHIFLRRMARGAVLALIIVGGALCIGICGYHYIEGLPWIDALLDASMILSGMGPVATLKSNAGKLFASFYALFSGVVFISTIGVVIAPLVHRFLHKFHLEAKK